MNRVNAYTAALFSREAYKPVGSELSPELRSGGWREKINLSAEVGKDGNVTGRMRVFENDSSKEDIIAFKGSDTIENFKNDLLNDGGDDYKSIAEPAKSAVATLRRDSPGFHVYTTGHSEGGGEAQSAALADGLDGFAQNSLPISSGALQIITQGVPYNVAIANYQANNTFQVTNVAGDIATTYYSSVKDGYYLDPSPTTVPSALAVPAIAGQLLCPTVPQACVVGFAAAAQAHLLGTLLDLVKDLPVGADGRFDIPLPVDYGINSENIQSRVRYQPFDDGTAIVTVELAQGSYTLVLGPDGKPLADAFENGSYSAVDSYQTEDGQTRVAAWTGVDGEGEVQASELARSDPDQPGYWSSEIQLPNGDQAELSIDPHGAHLQTTHATEDGVATSSIDAAYGGWTQQTQNSKADGSWQEKTLDDAGSRELREYDASSQHLHEVSDQGDRHRKYDEVVNPDGSSESTMTFDTAGQATVYDINRVDAQGTHVHEWNYDESPYLPSPATFRYEWTTVYSRNEAWRASGDYSLDYYDSASGDSLYLWYGDDYYQLESVLHHADGSSDHEFLRVEQGIAEEMSQRLEEADGSFREHSETRLDSGFIEVEDRVHTELQPNGSFVESWNSNTGNAGYEMVDAGAGITHKFTRTGDFEMDTYTRLMADGWLEAELSRDLDTGAEQTSFTYYSGGWANDMDVAEFERLSGLNLSEEIAPPSGMADFNGTVDLAFGASDGGDGSANSVSTEPLMDAENWQNLQQRWRDNPGLLYPAGLSNSAPGLGHLLAAAATASDRLTSYA